MTSKQLTSSTILVSLAFFTAGSPLHPMCKTVPYIRRATLASGGRANRKIEFQFKRRKGGSGVTKNGNNFLFPFVHVPGWNKAFFTYIEHLLSVELAKRAFEKD